MGNKRALFAVLPFLWVNGQLGGGMTAGAPAEWKFQFREAETNQLIHHYHVMHEKELHLIAVSEDLSDFAHLHPTLRGHTGFFDLPVNQPSSDPDNGDARSVTPRGGAYFLFAEMMPHIEPMQMLTVPMTVSTSGPVERRALELDPVGADGLVVKQVGNYRATMRVEPLDHFGGWVARFHLRLSEWDGTAFRDVVGLQKWLGMYGHGILVSEAGTTADTKTFRHIHSAFPIDPEDGLGPELILFLDSHPPLGPVPDGVYKMWVQFRHRGQVITVPFVIRLANPSVK